jgi:hypothetical protein
MLFAIVLTVALNATTTIPIETTSDISSRTANVGDRFTFATTADRTIDNVTIPKGTPGYGIVAAVSHAAGTRRGDIELRPQFLTPLNSAKIAVYASPQTPLKQHAPHHFFGLPFITPAGLVVGGVVTTGDVTIKRGTGFTVMLTPPSPAPSPTR